MKIIIYSHLNRSRELAFKEEENDVMIIVLIEWVVESMLKHTLKSVE